jgi:hypothetical protein
VEPDPKAVEVARARGLTVHLGGLETLHDASRRRFEGITLNHVIEHVHHPLRDAGALLPPAASAAAGCGWRRRTWTRRGTPAIGEHWVGLDTPRHLVVFADRALLRLLREEVGFARIERLPYCPLCARVYGMSRALRDQARRPTSRRPLPPRGATDWRGKRRRTRAAAPKSANSSWYARGRR